MYKPHSAAHGRAPPCCAQKINRVFRARTPDVAPAAQRGARERRKRVQLDVGADHRAATQLPGNAIRALLQDRAPLLRPRARGLPVPARQPAADPFHVVRDTIHAEGYIQGLKGLAYKCAGGAPVRKPARARPLTFHRRPAPHGT